MATVNVTSDSYLDTLSYSAGDTITISNGAVLTIRQTPSVRTGTIQCQSTGKLLIKPTAPVTAPLVFTFNTFNNDFIFQQNGQLEIDGEMLDIYTGDGTASQTIISGRSVLGATIDFPGLVMVETGSGTGVFIPWGIVTTTYTGAAKVWLKTYFSTGEQGNILFWNNDTGALTCGDGTNGNVIPNGAKVQFPSIHVTSNSTNATYSSKSTINLNPAGTARFSCVSFSQSIYFWLNNYVSLSISKVGVIGRALIQNSSGDTDIDTLISSRDPYCTLDNGNIGAFIQNIISSGVSIKNIYGQGGVGATGMVGVNIQSIPDAVAVENLHGYYIEPRVAAGNFALSITNVNVTNGKIVGVYSSGGSFQPANLVGQTIQTVRYSDTMDGVVTTAQAQSAIAPSNIKFVTLYDVETLGTAVRNSILSVDNQSDSVVMHTFDVDQQSHGSALLSSSGTNTIVANGTINNIRSGQMVVTSGNAGSFILRGAKTNTYSTASYLATNSRFENCQIGSTVQTQLNNYPDAGPYSTLLDSGLATGNLVVGPFGIELSKDLYDVTGGIYWNNAGAVYLPLDGDVLVIKNVAALRGITDFQNVSPSITETGSGLAYEFRVSNYADNAWSSWASLTGANLSAALGALTGYDSDVGFDMQVRVTATGADSTRSLSRIVLATDNDSGFVPDIGTTKVGVSGAIPGTRIAAFTYPAGVFIGSTVLSTDEGHVDCPYAFLGGADTVTLRVRYPGYAPIVFNVDYSQATVTIPVTLVENKDIQGLSIYGRGTGATTSLISFDIANLRIDIADGRVSAEDLYDMVCVYQATEEGIQAPEILTFDGRDILLDPLSAGWLFRRAAAGDTNAGVDALPVLAGDPTASPDDETNGSVDFAARTVRTLFSANDTAAVAQAVIDAGALTTGKFLALK